MIPDKRLAPPIAVESLKLYIVQGIPPGDFLEAVLANDLMEAVGRADCNNLAVLPHIVAWVYIHVPRVATGSFENVRAWLTTMAEKRTASKATEEVPGE